jgi:type VI secretion system protein VasG
VSLLDNACARVAVSLHATPAEVDDSRERIEALETELGIIGREKAIGVDIDKRESEASELLAERARLAELDTRWADERKLVDELPSLRAPSCAPASSRGRHLEAEANAAVVRGDDRRRTGRSAGESFVACRTGRTRCRARAC